MNKYTQRIIVFLGLTFAISWLLDLFRIWYANQNGFALSNEVYFTKLIQIEIGTINTYLPITLSTLIWAPTISALLTSLIFDKTSGLIAFIKSVSQNFFTAKWFLIASVIHLFLIGSSLIFGFITGGFIAPIFNPIIPLIYALPFLVYLILFTGLAEEIGWRGYLLPILQKRFTLENASIFLGIIWAAWHIPLTFYAYRETPTLLPFTLIGLFAGTIGWSCVVSWFYNHSKSVMMTAYLHGFGNFLLSYTVLSLNYPTANTFYGFAPWIIVFFLERKFGKNYLKPTE